MVFQLLLLYLYCLVVVQAWYMDAIPSTQSSSFVETTPPTQPTVGYFLRDLGNATQNTTIPLTKPVPTFLHGLAHYRLLPGLFPDNMKYHFDGLATVLKFQISQDGTAISYRAKAFQDQAAIGFKKCIFYGTGTGPTLGTQICFTNPGVNLLPIDGQLWLTIDTAEWGRVDPMTLDTVVDDQGKVLQPQFVSEQGVVNHKSLVLNAHPACDRQKNICYVQHPCPKVDKIPLTDQICFSVLKPGDKYLNVQEVARATMNSSKLIQHSHSPCLTEHYVVSKLDAFVARNPLNKNKG